MVTVFLLAIVVAWAVSVFFVSLFQRHLISTIWTIAKPAYDRCIYLVLFYHSASSTGIITDFILSTMRVPRGSRLQLPVAVKASSVRHIPLQRVLSSIPLTLIVSEQRLCLQFSSEGLTLQVWCGSWFSVKWETPWCSNLTTCLISPNKSAFAKSCFHLSHISGSLSIGCL